MKVGKKSAAVGALIGVLLVGGAGVGRAQQGTVEKAGEKVDGVLREIRSGFKNLSEEVKVRFARVRTEVESMTVESRVYGRLHWDKALQGAHLAVEVRDEGVTVLEGNVPDAAAKAKAVVIARDTIGVTQVIDRLAITPPAEETRP